MKTKEGDMCFYTDVVMPLFYNFDEHLDEYEIDIFVTYGREFTGLVHEFVCRRIKR